MIYVMSDIHGEYDKFIAALKTIHFNDEDTLYILGDMLDRGKEGIRILQDIMYRSNIIPILGNHEFMALNIFKVLMKEITEDSLKLFSEDFVESMGMWIKDGGKPTLDAFKQLTQNEREDIITFIEDFEVYEEITINKKNYFLSHAGLNNFDEFRDISDYYLHEFIFGRCDYNKVYFKDKILVTGHTPTRLISGEDQVYKKNNHLAIDCGCVFGGKLALVCLDNGEEFYI